MSCYETAVFDFGWVGKAVGVNNRYVNRKFTLTAEYRQFVRNLSWCCYSANFGTSIIDDVYLEITMRISRKRDSDSLLKPLFDAIQASGVIRNDRQIRGYRVEVEDKRRGELDWIEVIGKEIKK